MLNVETIDLSKVDPTTSRLGATVPLSFSKGKGYE